MIIFAYVFFLAFTPLMFLYSVLGINFAPRMWRRYLPWLILTIGMIAYGMQSKAEIDMDRYFQVATEIGRLPFIENFNYQGGRGGYEGLWVTTMVFWLVGRLNVVHILPMLAGEIVYGVSFYITCDTAERYSAYAVIPKVIAIQTCILPFFSIISNIRNVTAFSLVVMAVYLDTVKKKRNLMVLLLYALPIFMHSSTIILILLRIGLSLGKKAKVLSLTIVCLLPVLIDTLYTYIGSIPFGGSFGSIIRMLIQKGYWYLHDKSDSAWARQVASSKFQQLNRLVMTALAIVIICLVFFGTLKHLWKEYEKFASYAFLLSIMTISCSWFTTPHYWRFSAATVVSAGAVFVPLFGTKRHLDSWVMFLTNTLFGFALIGIPLQLWPMKYNVDLLGWFENMILNNFYAVVFQIIKGLFLA